MPLSKAQQEFIDGAINHLLDFPETYPELKNSIKKLKHALSSPPDDENHEFYALARCLRNPRNMFQRLEDYNRAVSVGDVQDYILQLITSKLERITTKLEPKNAKLHWHLKKMRKRLIAEHHYNEVFKSVRPPTVSTTPAWELIHPEGSIYTASLMIDQGNELVRLDIKVKILDETSTIKIIDFYSVPMGDYDQATLLTSLIPHAKLTAKENALEFVTRLLKRQQKAARIRHHDLVKKPVSAILTDEFYLNLVLKGEINFPDLVDVTTEQADLLLKTPIKTLLERKLCRLPIVMGLKQHEILLISTYFPMLISGQIHLTDITGVSHEQTYILVLPLVNNLIQTKKLKLSEAKLFPVHLRRLFSSDLYSDFFMREPINWVRISMLTPDDCDFLLSQTIANLIKHKKFHLTDVIFFTHRQKLYLHQPQIQSLLLNNKIFINELLESPPDSIALICEQPMIYNGIMQGLISLPDTHQCDLDFLHTKIISRRLLALFENRIYMINGKQDCLDQIREDINQTNEGIDTQLPEKIIRQFLWQMQIKIYNLLSENPNKAEIPHLQTMLAITGSSKEEDANCFRLFDDLIAASRQLSSALSHQQHLLPITFSSNSFMLFSHETKARNKIWDFCKKLSDFSSLTEARHCEERSLRRSNPVS